MPGGLDEYRTALETNPAQCPHYYISRDGTVTQLLDLEEDTRFVAGRGPAKPDGTRGDRIDPRRIVGIALEGGGPLWRHPDGKFYYEQAADSGQQAADSDEPAEPVPTEPTEPTVTEPTEPVPAEPDEPTVTEPDEISTFNIHLSTPRVPFEYCEKHPHNGRLHYEMFTDRQLAALKKTISGLRLLMGQTPRYSNQLSVTTPEAAAGIPAVWLRLSYSDRYQDPHPQPSLLTTIKHAVQP